MLYAFHVFMNKSIFEHKMVLFDFYSFLILYIILGLKPLGTRYFGLAPDLIFIIREPE